MYRRLRDEAPLYHDEARGIWAFSRFEDVQRAARDWQTFSSREGNDHDDGYQLFQPAGDVAALDPPEHTRLRDALHGAFRPSDIRERFEPAVRIKARRLIDDCRLIVPIWRRNWPGRSRAR
jgi:cytochrome P450